MKKHAVFSKIQAVTFRGGQPQAFGITMETLQFHGSIA